MLRLALADGLAETLHCESLSFIHDFCFPTVLHQWNSDLIELVMTAVNKISDEN